VSGLGVGDEEVGEVGEVGKVGEVGEVGGWLVGSEGCGGGLGFGVGLVFLGVLGVLEC
jgi:hypothetical protein